MGGYRSRNIFLVFIQKSTLKGTFPDKNVSTIMNCQKTGSSNLNQTHIYYHITSEKSKYKCGKERNHAPFSTTMQYDEESKDMRMNFLFMQEARFYYQFIRKR